MTKGEAEFIDELIKKIKMVVEKSDDNAKRKYWGVNSTQFLKKYGHIEKKE
ncbi:hypothetical protein THOM_0430 [Trachipleistophora hominis]|uniref:Uncharacterized protein n=1 Tax=Trachipleistophora hominis TaxID=72359 RepID=L7JZ73_TRAHO|nr:hypothetical protein THOM_0430 [Trachipleistophora hominis]